MTTVEMRRCCADCKEVKPLSAFSPRGKGYFASYCKPCNSERTKVYNRNHADELREKGRAYRARNPEKTREYNRRGGRRWREKNPDYFKNAHAANRNERNQRSREWYQKNRAVASRSAAKWRLLHRESAAEKMFARIRQMMPSGLLPDIAEEATQNLMVSVLAGETKPDAIQSAVRKFVKEAWPSDMSTLSLDARIGDSGTALKDLIDRPVATPRPIRPRGRPRASIDLASVTQLRDNGQTWSQVAKVLGVHRNTLLRYVSGQVSA